jgi:hypothetical protein
LARNPFARKYEDDEDYSGISSSSSDTDDDTSNNNNSPVQKELHNYINNSLSQKLQILVVLVILRQPLGK